MSGKGFEDVLNEYEEILDNKKPLPNGKFYRECDEQEKKRFNKLLDMVRIVQRTIVEKKVLGDEEKSVVASTIIESMFLNVEIFAKQSENEKKRQISESEQYLKKLDSVLGKEYVDPLRRIAELLKRANRPTMATR